MGWYRDYCKQSDIQVTGQYQLPKRNISDQGLGANRVFTTSTRVGFYPLLLSNRHEKQQKRIYSVSKGIFLLKVCDITIQDDE